MGSIIVFPNPQGISWLGNIFVDPKYQNLGLGSQLIQFVENHHPKAKKWKLETPAYGTRNHHFYKKNGYYMVEKRWVTEENMESFVFEKEIQ